MSAYTIDSNSNIFICNICQIGLVKSNIISHMKKKHGLILTEESIGPQYDSLVQNWNDLSQIYGKNIPGHDLIPYIKGLPIYNGYKSTHPDVIFYAQELKQLQKALRIAQIEKINDYISSCKVQQLFKQASMQQYIGVVTLQASSLSAQAFFSEAEKALPRLIQTSSTKSKDGEKFKRLHMKQRLEQYDFEIKVPREGEAQYDLYELFRTAILEMVKKVQTNMDKFNVRDLQYINGGKNR
jgi:hypothetical protein